LDIIFFIPCSLFFIPYSRFYHSFNSERQYFKQQRRGEGGTLFLQRFHRSAVFYFSFLIPFIFLIQDSTILLIQNVSISNNSAGVREERYFYKDSTALRFSISHSLFLYFSLFKILPLKILPFFSFRTSVFQTTAQGMGLVTSPGAAWGYVI